MITSTQCSACLRLIRSQYHSTKKVGKHLLIHVRTKLIILHFGQISEPHLSSKDPFRRFSSTPGPFAAQAVLPQSTNRAAIPSTKIDPPAKKVNYKSDTTSPTQKLAQKVRQHATGVTETYVAYGISERLVKECAQQADYTMPQAYEKGVEIPKTKDGEDLGIGTGWWYESMPHDHSSIPS